MERGNFSAAAGFGMDDGRQGVFSTFSAFLEMCISEITMARLNQSNVLCHFSHSGVDDMADNTCHFGLNHFFADGGIPGAPADTDHSPDEHADTTRLYFPGDPAQFEACVKRVFTDIGLRFVFSNRSKLPWILAEDGSKFYEGQTFEPGMDDVVRDDFTDGVIVTYGATLHRAVAAAEKMKDDGQDRRRRQQGLPQHRRRRDDEEDRRRPPRPRRRGAQREDRPGLPLRLVPPAGRLHRPLRPHRHPRRGQRRPLAPDGLPGAGPRGHREELPRN